MVILGMNAMVGLLHLGDLVFYKQLTGYPEDDVDASPIPRTEVAHVTLKMKPREGQSGHLKPVAYTLRPHTSGELGASPSAWVLEGLTAEY